MLIIYTSNSSLFQGRSCVVMNHKGTWLDQVCRKKHDFVCEKPRPKAPANVAPTTEASATEAISTENSATEPPATKAPTTTAAVTKAPSTEATREKNVTDTCDKGWHAYGNSCYLVGDRKENRWRANKFCNRWGAQLAGIKDEAENEAVTALLGKR